MAGFLDEHDLKPTSTGKYIMNASTAPKWIGFIASILDRLRQTFDDELKDSTMIQDGSKKPDRKFLDKGRVEAVDSLTRVLYLIFGNRELQNLFGLDSLRKVTLLGTLPNERTTPNSQLEETSSDECCYIAAQSANPSEVDHGESSDFSFRMFDTDGVKQHRASGVKTWKS